MKGFPLFTIEAVVDGDITRFYARTVKGKPRFIIGVGIASIDLDKLGTGSGKRKAGAGTGGTTGGRRTGRRN